MSISHIEDLLPSDILHIIDELQHLDITEKVDGTNLTFGLDTDGQFFTSREQKSGERIFDIAQYDQKAANDSFIAAHLVLSSLTEVINNLSPGDEIEAEILYGSTPNAITYGQNRIVFIRTISGQNKIPSILNDINNTIIRTTPRTVSLDGITTYVAHPIKKWAFSDIPQVYLSNGQLPLEADIAPYRKWVTDNPLSSFRTKSEFLKQSQEQFLPIKEILLRNIVRRMKPVFRTVTTDESNDIGIEGVVICDHTHNIVTKLIDKHNFSIINQFNFAIRNQIKGKGFNDTLWKPYSPKWGMLKFSSSSIYDEMLSSINDLLKIKGLSRYLNITRTIKSYQSIDEFIGAWDCQDIWKVKQQGFKAINTALVQLSSALTQYQLEWRSFFIDLTDGRTVKYNIEIHMRTLIVFAEIRKELTNMRYYLRQARTLEDVAHAFYSKQLRKLNNPT